MSFLGFGRKSNEQIAESYLRSMCDENATPGSIRHYMIEEVTDSIEFHTGVSLRDDQTVKVVQRIRDDYGYGPIAEHNLPGYASSDDYSNYPEELAERQAQNASREERNARIAEEQSSGGFIGWLFGR